MSLADSPFANRLNTNYVPSDSEILEIRALLVGPADELARIDAQMKELEIALNQLREQRASLNGPIEAHGALLSPIRRIPQDILLAIFFACLPSEHNAVIDPAEAPLVLGRICRHWRDITYSTPMLWSSLHIPALSYLDAPPKLLWGLQRTVGAWLGRSGTCPLSISLFDRVNRFIPNDLENHSLVLQLLPVAERLRHLTLIGDLPLIGPFLRLDPESLLLKSIRIELTSNISLEDVPDLANVLQLPTLEDVTLCMSSPIDPRSLPVKWCQLTRLRLECYSIMGAQTGALDLGGAFDVLRSCPNLTNCTIQVTKGLQDHDSTLTDISPIVLPHMHVLVFSGWIIHLQKWIPHLVVPNLRVLRVGQVILQENAIDPTREGYMSMEIDPNEFTSSGLHELLQCFPTISHLRLSSTTFPREPSAVDDAFMTLFHPPHDLCPMLTNLTIASLARFSDTTALAFVKARMALPTPLQELWIRFDREMEVDVMPELHSFISNGLRIALEYRPSPWNFVPGLGLRGQEFY
ncbi:hypothetical protein MSAN_01469400 [Mycena sanguinolenta]|uniref:F-box domain-containing protein n=1 Tax=Mycena sanguinolenta TaxID=230812 RepID=A0A8H7CYQ7_9AGAR|nr:hypothetical protein MSAN_01469400 [Mycena sanguinolenta]